MLLREGGTVLPHLLCLREAMAQGQGREELGRQAEM